MTSATNFAALRAVVTMPEFISGLDALSLSHEIGLPGNARRGLFSRLKPRSICSILCMSWRTYFGHPIGNPIIREKNERKQALENLHLKVNELQLLQAQNLSAVDLKRLATAKVQLKERLAEQNYYASKHKFTSDFENVPARISPFANE
ncbi:uncharacterized protein PHALS_14376 [Plasmopara halstedii]|uniref:Uncharacterized protein n=1 Tax=Plasmopara halstedii TaxID=4781 RepID=A0A0P1ATY4_PLAHL|nr:uncharacterized protein PHALS_14376 [Plasmopara halstedii]CEG44111.1 hypothetical protein PHALS_14376 [Plasmopara halstedii]|eukprot:XP_024580480.1 hypothetical protein PHALS_14376 [Plasmopara halstedii]